MIRRAITFLLLVSAIAAFTQPAHATGKFCLAWWREWGYYENSGNHSIHVWVFDENGNPMPGVDLYTSWGVLQGTTNSEGRCEIVMFVDNDRDVKCVDAYGSDSDVTPLMSTARWPNWGHYSYDCGFMFKADAASPGTFDTTTWGTVNLRDSNETDSPYTKSLVYNAINYADMYSDQYDLCEWGSHSQTFQATGVDRIVGVNLQGTIGGNYPLTWTAEIHADGPGGPLLFSKSSPYNIYPFRYFVPFGVNDCPVTPGATYAVTLTKDGGLNSYHVSDVYSGGQYYNGTTPNPSWDLVGFVVGMTYGSQTEGSITGTVRKPNGDPIPGATVTTTPGGYSDDTSSTGSYLIYAIPPGTYDVTASATGYSTETQHGVSVTAGDVVTVDFVLTPQSGTITGTVTAAGGGGIEGASIETTPGDYRCVTGPGGAYTLGPIPTGTYTVSVYAPTYISQNRPGITVTTSGSATVDFTLSPSGKVAHILDDFNGQYVQEGNDWLEESFHMVIENHDFFRETSRTLSPHTGTDSAQGFNIWINNDQYVSAFETYDYLYDTKEIDLVQIAADRGWEEIDTSQPITYIVYCRGLQTLNDPDDPNVEFRQTLAIHRPEMYIGQDSVYWRSYNNDTWIMLHDDVTGLADGRRQWITFEHWYTAYIRGMSSGDNRAYWDNLMIEYTPAADTTPPGYVTNFTATAGPGRVTLEWDNPSDSDFTGTMIRYSTSTYPSGPTDGQLLVDKAAAPGSHDSFIHEPATPGVTYYYAAFAHDEVPNYAMRRLAYATPTAAEYTSPAGWLVPGWNMMAIPATPTDPEASSVLADLAGLGNTIDNNLFRYTGSYEIYPSDFQNMETGTGYWLYLTIGGQTSFYGTPATSEVHIPLLSGWTLLGHPLPTGTPLAEVSVTDGVTTKSMDQAVADGWVEYPLYYYEEGVYKTLEPDGDSETLTPWRAYWMLANTSGLELVVPVQ